LLLYSVRKGFFPDGGLEIIQVKILYLGLFGGAGCVARYMVSGLVYNLAGRTLPYGTLAVNVTGSLLLGLIMEGSLRSTLLSPDLRFGLTVGFLGGFTTFSTFSYETVRLLEEGSLVAAGANILLNVTVCICAALIGVYLARQM
jgi:CrcB protein